MKKYIELLRKKVNGLGRKSKYVLAVSLFLFLSFGVLSTAAFSDWFFNHRTPHTTVTRPETEIKESENSKVENVQSEQNNITQSRSVSAGQNSQPTKQDDTISEADKEKLDDFKKQAEEYNKQTKESLDNLKETLDNQKITAPKTNSITVPDVDTEIKTPESPKIHYTTTCWDDTLLGKQCKTTMSVD